tara:strand:+ start:49 stop:294 length:246 start_codon:yes stop_codon:yes gene_type:complete
MSLSKRSFFAYKTDRGYILSLSENKGRKNYPIEQAPPERSIKETPSHKEAAPIAIESFALNPEHYCSLMERIGHLHRKQSD